MIRARQVRVIEEDGTQLGIISTADALQAARQRDLDLIEVAPNADPPVCRIMDYGKYKYQIAKREREAHKKQTPVSLRPIRVRPMIGEHDLEVKSKIIRRLLEEGSKVKINVFFRSGNVFQSYLCIFITAG